jgi:hypothetical protein
MTTEKESDSSIKINKTPFYKVELIMYLPRLKKFFKIYSVFTILFGVLQMIMHNMGGSMLTKWIMFSSPILDILAKYNKALYEVPNFMRLRGYYSRIEMVQNVILWDFIVYLIFSAISYLIIIIDFKKDGELIIESINNSSNIKNKIPALLIFAAAFLSISSTGLVFSSYGFCPPWGLFYLDIQFPIIGIMFMISAAMNAVLIIISTYYIKID